MIGEQERSQTWYWLNRLRIDCLVFHSILGIDFWILVPYLIKEPTLCTKK